MVAKLSQPHAIGNPYPQLIALERAHAGVSGPNSANNEGPDFSNGVDCEATVFLDRPFDECVDYGFEANQDDISRYSTSYPQIQWVRRARQRPLRRAALHLRE